MNRRWTTALGAVALTSIAVLVPAGTAHAATVPDQWLSETGGPGNARTNAGETTLTAAAAPGITQTWTRPNAVGFRAAPAVVGNVGYEVTSGANPQFQAFVVKTGRTLWTLALPRGASYARGVTVVGSVALMSFDATTRAAGGVTAVGLTNQHVIWSIAQPAGAAGTDRKVSGPIVAAGSTVYLLSSVGVLSAYALSDGSRQWRTTITGTAPDGLALGNGTVYTGSRTDLVAYDVATGKKQWTGPGRGVPVVAGGRVVSAYGDDVVAVSAAGCGAATCDALWETTLPYKNVTDTQIGGLDDTYGYLTYTEGVKNTGGLVRFGAISGRVIWRAPLTAASAAPVRAAETVWTVVGGTSLQGFSTTATALKPLVKVTEATALQGDDQALAVARGFVFVRTPGAGLAAYGLPAA